MKLSILTQLFSQCTWWLLFWMFLAFLLGWLLRKLFSKEANCCDELDTLKQKYADLDTKYQALLHKKTKKRVQTVPNVASLTGTKKKPKAKVQSKAKTTAKTPYSKLKADNLQIIEGIGPKMDEVLKKHNIKTWADLAGQTPSELRHLLDNENPKRYKIIDPATWSDQAQLAVDGKWRELIAMQKDLDTGKTNTTGGTDSKLEKIMQRMGLLKKWKQDDLKAIEGIGPKIAGLLKESGITTWKALSEASVDSLQEVLKKAGPRFKLADPGTWPKQAQLAHENKWDELQAYQDFLNGGK